MQDILDSDQEDSLDNSIHYDSAWTMKNFFNMAVKEESDCWGISKKALPGSPYAMFYSNNRESVRHPVDERKSLLDEYGQDISFALLEQKVQEACPPNFYRKNNVYHAILDLDEEGEEQMAEIERKQLKKEQEKSFDDFQYRQGRHLNQQRLDHNEEGANLIFHQLEENERANNREFSEVQFEE